MAAFTSRHRRGGRWWLIGTTVAVAAVLAVFFVGASGANLSGSTFEGDDGNLVVNTPGNTDWESVAGRNTGIDKPSGRTDNAFGQGTKEDNAQTTVVTGSIPPNKNDLTRFYEASEQAGNGHIYLYLGWERLVNIGNANLDFEINQNATSGFTSSSTGPVTLNRTAGDLLVSYDFGGSGTPTLGLNTWLTAGAGNTVSQCFSANALPCWGNHVTLNGTNSEGAVNTGTIAEPIADGSLTAGLFGEAAIDLTAAGVFQPGVCEAFGSAFLKSRSSSSFTAELKDFIAPIAVNVSNCTSITIHKLTEGGDSSFGYTTTGGLDPSTFSLSNGGTRTYDDLVPGSYSVTENLTSDQTTAGWSLESLVCTVTGSGSSQTINGSTASLTLGNGGTADCTYTNHLQAHPGISTAQDLLPNDSATISGGVSPGGSITFDLYPPSNATCTGTGTVHQVVPVSGNDTYSTTNTTIHATTTGMWRWKVHYSGDANNDSADSACGVENFTITNG